MSALLRTVAALAGALAAAAMPVSARAADAETGNRLRTRVTFVEALGSSTQAYGEYAGLDEPLTCQLDGRTPMRPGQPLELVLPARWCYLFDDQGHAYHRLGAPAADPRDTPAPEQAQAV